MGSGRRTFSREFKVEAVKLVTEAGHQPAQVAFDLGVHPNTIHKWVRQYAERPQDAFPGKGHPLTEAETLRQLQRENERLRMERDILKKAVAIFSKDPK
jgi:transposase